MRKGKCTSVDTTVSEDGNVPSSPSFSSPSPPHADLDEERQNISLEKQKFFRSCPFYWGGRKSLSSSTPSGESNPSLSLPSPSPKPGSSMASLISSISKSYLARPRRNNSKDEGSELWGFAAAAARRSPLPIKSFIKPSLQTKIIVKRPSGTNFESIKACTLKPPTLTFDEMRNSKSGGYMQFTLGSTGIFNGLTSSSFQMAPRSLFSTVNKLSPPRSNPYTFPSDPDIPILPSCPTPRVGVETPPPGKLNHNLVCCYLRLLLAWLLQSAC